MDTELATDLLARQLQIASDANDDLRLMLKEERQRLMFREIEVQNLTQQTQRLEKRLAEVIKESQARHEVIERLNHEIRMLQLSNDSIRNGFVGRWTDRLRLVRRVGAAAARRIR